jgi:hypothetical protein
VVFCRLSLGEGSGYSQSRSENKEFAMCYSQSRSANKEFTVSYLQSRCANKEFTVSYPQSRCANKDFSILIHRASVQIVPEFTLSAQLYIIIIMDYIARF